MSRDNGGERRRRNHVHTGGGRAAEGDGSAGFEASAGEGDESAARLGSDRRSDVGQGRGDGIGLVEENRDGVAGAVRTDQVDIAIAVEVCTVDRPNPSADGVGLV